MFKRAGVAQLVEQLTCNEKVEGSIPFTGTTSRMPDLLGYFSSLQRFVHLCSINQWIDKYTDNVYTFSVFQTSTSAAMPKDAVFTMKLEPELRADFMAEAEVAHRPASQILRDLMREFVRRQREAREYDEFLRGKVSDARAQIRVGDYASAEEVEARFAAKRTELLAKAGNSGA